MSEFVMNAAMVACLTQRGRSVLGRATYKLGALLCEAPRMFDCSSFTQWLYVSVDQFIPRLSYQQFESCEFWRPARLACPGDLVFRRNIYARSTICPVLGVGHVGFVTLDLSVLHATSRAGTVVEESLDDFFRFTSSVMCAGVPGKHPRRCHCYTSSAVVWREDGKLGHNKLKTGP